MQYDRAITDYTEAIRFDPKNVMAYYNRGIAHADRQDYEKAINDYNAAIRLDPKYIDPLTSLSWLLATCPQVTARRQACCPTCHESVRVVRMEAARLH